jgi:hypothetical protein
MGVERSDETFGFLGRAGGGEGCGRGRWVEVLLQGE